MLTYPPDELPPATGPDADRWYAKARAFHHGDLRASALARAREIVAAHGPTALTLRGLARDLGVTAPALMYHFGRLTDLRAAVADTVLVRAAAAATLGNEAPRRLCAAKDDELTAAGAAWHTFAAQNANLYRLASGEGWRAQPAAPNGIHPGGCPTYSPRYFLQVELQRAMPRYGARAATAERASYLAFTLHGLALAGLDGVPERARASAWEDAVKRSAPGRARPGPGAFPQDRA